MNQETAACFERDFVPRITATLVRIFSQRVHIDVIPYGGALHPTRVRITGDILPAGHGYAHPLNVALTWDSDAIHGLLAPGGEARFARYLAALPRKLDNWQGGRAIDFGSRSQAEPSILLGGLDFEA
ncbi:DUF5594 family protein [Paraburkholderia gardini]|uniref:DUF5594 domain-containing protein n=1 Tax=Paraburkholderia gardini TaxID=2823469 RepID=A0ABN7QKI4_9BURK|nr:DUF5594 family protein [Paraburkholderia gardini]CAG4902156.1 hypothetical protein R54767_02821 [Paraburkholderia gardini]